ncbi:DUF2017 family protein [Microbacterium paraoxydans]|uniref:DUF2017 family protein n=1 Tax=Microbacterium paraoxydans TaxID=199592 RepID=UPI001CFB830D|nr:DUF2017 family protein [Microbacterium paraoxydans]
MTADGVLQEMTLIESFHLARLVDDFVDLVTDSRDVGDPAVERLAPTPYPEDSAAAAEFSAATRGDLLDRRLTDARTVRSALGTVPADAEALTEDTALTTREVFVSFESLEAWLRTLTALRLVIATRLGITSDEDVDEDDRHGIYDWLGYRLDLLVHAADETDAGPVG